MSKRFDAIIAKNNLARLLRQIQAGEFESISELPLRQIRFDLREIEIFTGELNQPSISDIMESEHEL
jgi:hypothetical protein